MTDEEIITGILKGEERALARVREWVRATIFSRTWTEGLSREDLVADSVIKIYVNLNAGKFRKSSSLKTYVRSVTYNTAVEALRRHKREQEMLKNSRLYQPPDTPEALLIEKDNRQLAARVFALAGEACKEIWRMLLREKQNYHRIAQLMGLKEGTVRVRVFRCKQHAMEVLRRITGGE